MNPREKFLVGLAFPAILVVAGYLYVWAPTYQRVQALRIELPLKAAEYAWMEHQLKMAEPLLAVDPDTGAAQPVLTIIEQRAIETGVKASIQRVQPNEDQSVKMWFEDVPADNWLQFVERLSVDGIAVDSATLTRKEEGIVSVRVDFKR